GAGKTTRVPPALATDGPVLVLQPRRAAARSLARRVAEERGWTLGREVGWHVRFEPRFGPDTRVLFATEGILTARLQQDPLLTDFRTVVLDEFHERSVHADLGIALLKQAWLARDDLQLVVMSATIDAGPISRFLDDCPVLDVAGAAHPLDIRYAPGASLAPVVDNLLTGSDGNVLSFLPGAREIDAAARALAGVATRHAVDVLPLHGSLPPDAQDAVLTPGTARRVVLATNLAETSVTVPGVRAVVDTGLQKVARYDAARGIDMLQTERVSLDAADQRAGRAARLGPGTAVRLWSAQDRLRPFREPDIARVDLTPLLLAILAWGGAVDQFEWFEAPAAFRVRDGLVLLQRLGAVDAVAGGPVAITATGRSMARLPVSPRLARMVLDTASRDVCLAAAVLSEGGLLVPDGRTTSSDVLSLLATARDVPHLRRAADAIVRAASDARHPVPGARGSASADGSEETLRRAVLAGYPDRVAQRRAPRTDALLLSTGSGARLTAASGVRDEEFLVALDVRAIEDRDTQVTLASGVDKAWLKPTATARRAWVDDEGRLRVTVRRMYDALVLHEQDERPRPEDHAALASAWHAAPRSERDVRLLARLAFVGRGDAVDAAVSQAATETNRLDDLDIEAALPWEIRQQISTDAPERLPLPSGRTAALTYDADGSVRAAVKLQELFGLADTPRIGPRREAVVFELLAPNGRPVQTTRDLRSFWTTTYTDVRKELRGRYPKHPWPEDPWTATPTHRTTRRQT
ncbi:MAG TPA: ATP-dependent helicase C-terminal domain-containing protein, partial [Luteitalea sp.]|nr:ATP-dependent helicase C-terminal domain-containing protein [Luteitalea sp.]